MSSSSSNDSGSPLDFIYEDIYTPEVENAIRYIGLPSAIVSLTCSLFIIQHVYRSSRERKRNPIYLRFMVGLSVFDVIASANNIAMTFVDGLDEAGSPGCTWTAFFLVTGFSSSMLYNAGLAIYFTLVVVRNLSNETLQKWFEPVVHILAIGGIGGLGIAGLFLDVYNPFPSTKSCFVGPECNHFQDRDEMECGRGSEYGDEWALIITCVAIISVVVVVISIVILYVYVWKSEKNNQRFWSASIRRHMSFHYHPRARSAKVARKGVFFGGGVVLVTIFGLIHTNLPEETQGSPIQISLALLENCFFPLQGFFDFLVYFQDRYLQWRKICPEDGIWFAIKMTTLTTYTPLSRRSTIRLVVESSRKSEEIIFCKPPDKAAAAIEETSSHEDDEERASHEDDDESTVHG